jgi:hypothetical protein
MNSDGFLGADQIKPADSQVDIIDLTAEPYQDRRRIKVQFKLSHFHPPPNASLALVGLDGQELAVVDIVNISQSENEITLHFPHQHPPAGDYLVRLTLLVLEERETGTDQQGQVELVTQKGRSRQTTFTLP